ncbi:MAG: glycosyltransferase family 2 protein [Sphingobacteriales bacterium]|nr:MAG: glycosyltransferase family 2 protein [Sphingobacteriales bacterium]
MISVVVPTHNRAHLISRTVVSIQQQTYTDWELLIVDDGSTDNTKQVVEGLLSDKRIRYIQKENSGAAESRNVGVRNASSELITFLDSDDEAEPQWLEKMFALIGKDEKVPCAFCGLSIHDEHGNKTDAKVPTKKGPLFQYEVCRFTNAGIFIMRKKYFDAVGGYDSKLRANQHTELGIRLIQYFKKHGLETKYILDTLIRINIHTGPRIRTNNKAKYEGTKRLFFKHKNLILKDEKSKKDVTKVLLYLAIKFKNVKDIILFSYYYMYSRVV